MLAACRKGLSLGARIGRSNVVIRSHEVSRLNPAQQTRLVQSARQRCGIQTAAAAQEVSPATQLPHVVETRGVPIYLYAPIEEVEEEAVQQLVKLAEAPLATGYISAMPDVHLGKGVTIGTVFASEEYVCPNAVGVDIGCGMCAVPIDGLHRDDLSLDDKLRIQQLIKKRIPVGFDFHARYPLSVRTLLDEISHEHTPSKFLEKLAAKEKACAQLGTLGGGNHFLEVVHDETDRVWIMLHSGSRGVGNETAQHHDKIAADFLQQQGIETPVGLNYMRIESEEGQGYLGDMEWCQRYAFENRAKMLSSMVECVEEVTGRTPDMAKAINIHHNYCSCERCRYKDPRTGEVVDKKLWVTRKGATSAKDGQLGIIPGSMGVGSYITRGRGNSQAWSSSSHGAGRKMSRTKAVSTIPQEEFVAAMDGIVCDTVDAVRDEAPQAYKDLSQVMDHQEDLTEIVHRLQPLINVKGFKAGKAGRNDSRGLKRLERNKKRRSKAAAAAADLKTEEAEAAVGAGEEESAATAVAQAPGSV